MQIELERAMGDNALIASIGSCFEKYRKTNLYRMLKVLEGILYGQYHHSFIKSILSKKRLTPQYA